MPTSSHQSAFKRFRHRDVFQSVQRWRLKATSDPNVYYNPTGGILHPAGTIAIQAKRFAMHPGKSGEYSVVRWRATKAGSYAVNGRFDGITTRGKTTTDVFVFHRSSRRQTKLARGYINVQGYGNSVTFSKRVSIKSGDEILFMVGKGNATYFGDSTQLTATICP